MTSISVALSTNFYLFQSSTLRTAYTNLIQNSLYTLLFSQTAWNSEVIYKTRKDDVLAVVNVVLV